MKKNDITIVVDKYCISACAQFLLLGASKVEVHENALVLLHQSGTALEGVLRASGSERADEYADLSRTERLFYKEVGADPFLLIGAFNAMKPMCFVEKGRIADELPGVVTRWAYSAVTPETYRRLSGVRVDGAWADDRHEIAESLRSVTITTPISIVPAVELTSEDSRSPAIVKECSNNRLDASKP